jgi:hypothetical protein
MMCILPLFILVFLSLFSFCSCLPPSRSFASELWLDSSNWNQFAVIAAYGSPATPIPLVTLSHEVCSKLSPYLPLLIYQNGLTLGGTLLAHNNECVHLSGSVSSSDASKPVYVVFQADASPTAVLYINAKKRGSRSFIPNTKWQKGLNLIASGSWKGTANAPPTQGGVRRNEL